MPHPKWLTELDKSLSADQSALFSNDLRAVLAKAPTETTDNETTASIAREVAMIALLELIPTALASNRSWYAAEDRKALVRRIEQWERTKRTTSANTHFVQALRTEAARHQTSSIGQSLFAAARLVCWSHPVSYANPRNRQAKPQVGKMQNVVTDFLTICLEAKSYDRVCMERGIKTVVEVINEQF